MIHQFLYQNRAWILPLVFVALIVVLAAWGSHDECPRTITGYKCRGNECDHSPAAVAKAKEVMGRDYWHGGPK